MASSVGQVESDWLSGKLFAIFDGVKFRQLRGDALNYGLRGMRRPTVITVFLHARDSSLE